MRVRTYLAAVTLACAIAAPASGGDLTIVSKTSSSGPVASSGTSTMYMTAAKLRMQQERMDVVVDIATGTITMIDSAKKQYWQMTREDIEAMSKAMSDKMAQMQKDPQGAAMMKTMMGAMGPAKLEKGTETKTIAGYSCAQYTLSMGETVRMIYWTTTALQPPFSWEQMYNAQTGILRANPMLGRMSSIFDEMKNMKGVPLASSTTMTMGPVHVENTSEATEVKTGAIPASTFDIPSTYTKVQSPMSQMLKR
jgi:hypothetical protein